MAQSIKLGSNTYLDASGIVDGTNLLSKTNASLSSSVDTTYADTIHDVTIYRMGKLRLLNFNFKTKNNPIATEYRVFDLPSVDKPDDSYYLPIGNQTAGIGGLLEVISTGEVRFYLSASSIWVRGTYVYFVS